MATVLMKNGEIIEVPDDEMLSFLQKNRDLIQDRYSPRKRPINDPLKDLIPLNLKLVI